MNFLLSNRTYNIEIVGAVGVGKSAFLQRLLTNTFTTNYVEGAIAPGVIAFPTPIGKITFNIRECRFGIYQQNLVAASTDQWANTDAFFVMTSYQDTLQLNEARRWIQTIRRVRPDVPIVLVDLKRDKPYRRGKNLEPLIRDICRENGNIPYVEVSTRLNQNIHGPFIALQNILRTSDTNMNVDNPNIPSIPLTPLLPVFQFPPPPAN